MTTVITRMSSGATARKGLSVVATNMRTSQPRVARSLTDNDVEAEDLVQDTLIRAYRGIAGFDGRHPRAWLVDPCAPDGSGHVGGFSSRSVTFRGRARSREGTT